jgi:ribosomal protein S18 acetylase RimI-like enzyme
MPLPERFSVPLEVEIRAATETDLPNLEWYGLYSLHRQIMDTAFEAQGRGEVLMLLAVANGFPIGQAWIDFVARADEPQVALIWAVRVFPFLTGGGIGRLLLGAAEAAIRDRGRTTAEIGVEKDNPRARRLYERLGYRFDRELLEEFTFNDWQGNPVIQRVDQWMLRKRVGNTAPLAALHAAAAVEEG